MSNDERPESLAAQAASWVPPWERQPRPPDREYQAAAEAAARAELARGESGLPDDEDGFEPADPEEHGSEPAEEPAEPETADRSDADAAGGTAGPEAAAEGGELVAAGGVAGREAAAEGGDLVAAGGVAGESDLASGGRAGETRTAGETAEIEAADEEDDGAATPVEPGGAEASESGDGPEAGAGAEEERSGSDDPETVETETGAFDGDDELPAAVDSPAEVGREPEPSADEVGPELPLPGAIERAAEDTAGDESDGIPADAPVAPDGDDAGDVFDAAADDDVSDDGELDLPIADAEDAAAGAVGGRGAPPPTQPEAESIVDRGPVVDVVPEQGRRRRDGGRAVGGGDARTGEKAEATAQSDQSDELPALLDDAELAAALEAIMLVVDEPVAEMQLAQILEQPTERVGSLLEDLSARYTAAGHGFDLRRAAGGWRLYTRPEYAAYVERFVLDGQSVRLTQAALETLAVVAYKQPVTRSRISAIRGVNCDGVMRTLVTRGLIEECGTEGETGAYLYRTTALFLEKLGLNSVEQLPPLAPFLPDDVEEVLDAPG